MMRNVVLYIGMSLDGYIADRDGQVDWMTGQDGTGEEEGTYPEFAETVDTVIMGYRTYRQLVTELSPEEWIYAGKQTYVITHRKLSDEQEIIFTDEAFGKLLRRLKAEEGKDIWVCGGADIVNGLLRENLIDRFRIAVLPIILGDGIRLFDRQQLRKKLRLTGRKEYNGIVELMYERSEAVSCKIEHHAVLFALLSKYAMELCGEEGEEAILEGMTRYGRERGARMAANAAANGDPLNTMTNQAYGEWAPDYEGQMEFGQIRTEPTYQTYVKKCAWCDAWKKHGLTAYGKYYCVNVDNAVYQGFREDFECKPFGTPLSFGGDCCRFDWGYPLTKEEVEELGQKRERLGTSCMKDFTFHTAHLKHTVGKTLVERLKKNGEKAVKLALSEYEKIFGSEYLAILEGAYQPEESTL